MCTPAAYHAESITEAARLGKHILSEKPISLTLTDADRIAAAVAEANVKVTFSFQRQHSPATRKLHDLIQSGETGRPVMWRNCSGAEIRPKLAMHDRNGNNGPFVDGACHFFTLWRNVLESEPVRVQAAGFVMARDAEELRTIPDPAVDTGSIVVTFESGDVGLFSTTWGLPKGVRAGAVNDILGPQGLIVPGDAKIRVVRKGGEEEVIEVPAVDRDLEQVRHLVDCIEQNKEPINGPRDARIALQVSLAALESMETGRTVEVYA